MSIVWKNTIELLDLPSKRVRIASVRYEIDAQETIVGKTFHCSMITTIDTDHLATERVRIRTAIWEKYLAWKAYEVTVDALLANWENTLDTDLVALET